MKKILILMIALVLGANPSFAGEVQRNKVPTEQEALEAQHLNSRLEAIQSIDRSQLTTAERKAMRREIREIKQRLGELGGGVYLSVAAIIIIVLLLILLL